MAVAGLHNVLILESPLLRESQTSASRRRPVEGRASTQASSLLQMWREIEDEHVAGNVQEGVRERSQRHRNGVFDADLLSLDLFDGQGSERIGGSEAVSESENENETQSQNQSESRNDHDDRNSCFSVQSSDFGVIERERVRQIFREWMNSGLREHASSVPLENSSPRAQWLGKSERERVRIVREWVQMTSQQRSTYGGSSEEQADEICDQIVRVRDGLVVSYNEGLTEGIRRDVRRLCGRQVFLDMLERSESERQRELQDLLEHQSVSNFPYRNRIQSLLRGRFLRSERSIEDERRTSLAASELGLLRQRHTVSDLREGFLSRLDNVDHGQGSSDHSDTSSYNDGNGYENEETQADNLSGVLGEVSEHSPHNVDGGGVHELSDHMGIAGNRVDVHESTTGRDEQFDERMGDIGEDMGGNRQERTASGLFQETLESDGGELVHMQEGHGVVHEEPEPRDEEGNIHELSGHLDNLEGNTVDDIAGQESFVEWQEHVLENEGSDWQRFASVEFNVLGDNTLEDTDRTWQESSANGWLQETSGNQVGEHGYPHEAHSEWHDDGSQEDVERLLEGPSAQEGVPSASVDTFFLPEDDNVHSMELRELLSRRSVSNLLHSGFRESLDQLVQSYVERQSHADVEWDVHNRTLPSPASAEEAQGNEDENDGQLDAVERATPVLSSLPELPSQSLWDQGLLHANWTQHNMHQHLRIDWEIITDLRVDMARLQQRMNNMQRMLEACMDMQLELQRSVRQEVSAAMNRSAGSPGVSEDSFPRDGTKWDHVRKGICCICCDTNIDSLLYRCGHMCTCSGCANELVQGGGKCPMCCAPVVELICAYSVQ